jgi:hypothetical protein
VHGPERVCSAVPGQAWIAKIGYDRGPFRLFRGSTPIARLGLLRRATPAATAEAAGSGGDHPRKGDEFPEPLEQDLAQAAQRSRGVGEPGIAPGRGGDPQRSDGRASGFPRGGGGRQVGATAAEEALQEVKMALEARVLTRPPIFSSALMVAVMKAGRVTCWCGTSKSARLPREQES